MGCSNKTVEQHKFQHEDPERNQNAFIEDEPVSRIGKETLQYPGETEEFEYSVYETYVEIDKYIENATEVIVPEKFENLPVKVVGGFYYKNSENIKKITLPESVVLIKNSAFEDCVALEYINIPESIKTISSRAFYDCTSLKSLTIPKNVTTIDSHAFGMGSEKYGGYSSIDTLVVKIHKGTVAAQYVAEHDIKFEIIDE